MCVCVCVCVCVCARAVVGVPIQIMIDQKQPENVDYFNYLGDTTAYLHVKLNV